MPRVRVVSSAAFHQWQELSRRLRTADPELKRALKRRLRQHGEPVLDKLQAAAWGITMESWPERGGGGSTGLRARISSATKLSLLASGVRFVVREQQVDRRYGRTLVAGSEGTPWRHPVYGNRNAWVTQKGSPWFYPTLRREAPEFRRAVERAIRDTLDYIEG